MYRTLIRNTTLALGTLLVGATLVMAAGLQGVVTGVDGKGMATVRTSDNKDHQVRVGDGLKLNDLKVQCEMKNNALECRPAQTQAAMTPSSSAPAKQATPGSAAPAKQATTPAPTTSTPAPSSSAPASSAPAPSSAPASK